MSVHDETKMDDVPTQDLALAKLLEALVMGKGDIMHLGELDEDQIYAFSWLDQYCELIGWTELASMVEKLENRRVSHDRKGRTAAWGGGIGVAAHARSLVGLGVGRLPRDRSRRVDGRPGPPRYCR